MFPIKFKWDDNPNISGLSVGTITIGNGKKVELDSKTKRYKRKKKLKQFL